MLLAGMLFMIGQELNLSKGYWIAWGIWLVVKIIGNMASFMKNCSLTAEKEEK